MSCPICQAEDGRVHTVREMMFATKHEFPYFECANCGCISLQRIPRDLGFYYEGGYYSFVEDPDSLISRSFYRFCLSPLGSLVKWFPIPMIALLARLHLTREMRVLDVGSGAGSLISILRKLGYQAQGIDPFVPSDIEDEFGVRVRKVTLQEVREQFNVILFLHSLEHMSPDALELARRVI